MNVGKDLHNVKRASNGKSSAAEKKTLARHLNLKELRVKKELDGK